MAAQDIALRAAPLFSNKRLLFIPTAAEVEKGDMSWLAADRQKLVDAGFEVDDFSITNQTEDRIRERLSGYGSICVSGGNTYYLLDQARKTGFDKVVKELVAKGLVYLGASAGSSLAGSSIQTALDDPSVAPDLHDYTGLKFVDVYICPHWGGEHFKEEFPKEIQMLQEENLKTILLRDDQYLQVKDGWYQIVSV